MKIIAKVEEKKKDNKELNLGDPVQLCKEEGEGIYFITCVGLLTFSLLKIGFRPITICVPKNQVKPIYGTVTITSEE